MRRAFVPDDDAAGAFGFTLGFTVHKAVHLVTQDREFPILTRDHVG